MSDPKHLDVTNALVRVLARIGEAEGDNYTPERVGVSLFPIDSYLVGTHVILVRPGATTVIEQTTHTVQEDALYTVTVARRHEQGSENPWETPLPRRDEVVDRAVDDVVGALLDDPTLKAGGTTSTVENVAAEEIAVNRDMPHESWAMAEITFTCRYNYQRSPE